MPLNRKGILRLCGLALAGTMLVVGLSSCAESGTSGWVVLEPEPSASGEPLQIVGTVHYLDLEGGLFVIRDAGGVQYNPVNLPDDFRQDGMSIEAEAYRRNDMVSIGMVGPLIELIRVRPR